MSEEVYANLPVSIHAPVWGATGGAAWDEE